MRKYLLLIIVKFSVVSVYAQMSLAVADSCYKLGDYECAREKYGEYLKASPNNEAVKTQKENADICALLRKDADDNYQSHNYQEAQKSYMGILSINPVDVYAKRQFDTCVVILKPEIKLSVSKSEITFTENGGESEISVITNFDTFKITPRGTGYNWMDSLKWIKITKSQNILVISCDTNNLRSVRSGSLIIRAEDKEVIIKISQLASSTVSTASPNNVVYTKPKKAKYTYYDKKENDYHVGFSSGFIQVIDKSTNKVYEGAQMTGLTVRGLINESCFGLSGGVYWEHYFSNRIYNPQVDFRKENNHTEKVLRKSFINYQLHLEYQLNFSKYFNLILFGGGSFDYQSKKKKDEDGKIIKTASGADSYDEYARGFLDLGGGIRIDHILINAGYGFGKDMRKKMFAIAYVFAAE